MVWDPKVLNIKTKIQGNSSQGCHNEINLKDNFGIGGMIESIRVFEKLGIWN